MIQPPMTLDEAKDKHIYINICLRGIWTPAGVITFNEAHGYAGFSYFQNYIDEDHPPLNPATLNHRDTKSRHFMVDSSNNQMLDRTFWELLPTSGDFGHHAIIGRFPQYSSMNNAQKLYFLGSRVVGGLAAYVKRPQEEVSIDSTSWLDQTRKDAVQFHLKEVTRLRHDANAFLAMTSYGGVRPKAMYKDADNRLWIAKFNLPTDPYDMAIAEHVAMNMAKSAGMKTPDTKVLSLPSGENVFLTERFDQKGTFKRHSLALFSLAPGIELGGNGPKANTAGVMATIVRRFSDFKSQDSANIVLKFLVDVGFNNVDNHLRNTRIILNDKGLWELSPVFDITFCPRSQPHVYNPAGLALADTHLSNDAMVTSLSKMTGVDEHSVDKLRQKTITTAEKWEDFCDEAGMNSEDKHKIGAAISLGLSRVELANRIKMDHRKKIENVIKNAPKPN